MVAQVADVTKNLPSAMEMVGRGNWIMFLKKPGYTQTMKKEEEFESEDIEDHIERKHVAD